MKKNLMIVSFAFIFLLSVSIVSAGWLSDLFSGKATGDAVITGRVNQCTGNSMCWDCDNEGSCTAGGCSWDGEQCNQKGIFSGGGHCINPDQPCPMRAGAGFQAAAGTDTQFAVQSVDAAIGIASIVVKDSRGNLQTVTVTENGHASLSDGSVLRVEEIGRKRFLRGGETVSITVTPPGTGVGASVGGVATGVVGAHTHLVDYQYTSKPLAFEGNGNPISSPLSGEIDCTKEFGEGYVVLGGGFSASGTTSDVLTNGPVTSTTYQVKIVNHESGRIYATCARLENAIDSGEPHF